VNPVYYVQYANARLCNMLEMAEGKYGVDYSGKGLTSEAELALMKKLSEYPKTVEDSALTLSPYKITIYTRDLAALVNDFYTKCRVLDSENPELSASRLGLCKASSLVLENALNLIGVSAPKHM
jgi:arginyl-tRNA synthetase